MAAPATFRSAASGLALGVAVLAPWMAGARSHLPGVLWVLGSALVLLLALVVLDALTTGRRLEIPWIAATCTALLVACLGWWATQRELSFATPFGAEHWGFLTRTFPTAILQWPRGERLFFNAAVLLCFLATIALGRSDAFRERLTLVIGATGIAIVLYALGQRWGGWPFPAWLQIAGYTERYNATFFHHSGPAACLNFAWPLLVFHRWRRYSLAPNFLAAAVVVPIAILAIPLWKSQSAWAVGLGLFLAGFTWLALDSIGKAHPAFVLTGILGIFCTGFVWQWTAVHRMKVQHPDHWISARQTRWVETPARDARFRAQAAQRGDRLIPSPTPPRPASWLTAGRMALDHPLLGAGPGSWVKESMLYSNDSIVNTFYQDRQFAHHDLLQVAAEWGIAPAALCVVLWVGGFARAARRAPGKRKEIALVLALVAMGFHSQLHFPLQIPAFQIWTAFLLGLAWSGPDGEEPTPPPARPRRSPVCA